MNQRKVQKGVERPKNEESTLIERLSRENIPGSGYAMRPEIKRDRAMKERVR